MREVIAKDFEIPYLLRRHLPLPGRGIYRPLLFRWFDTPTPQAYMQSLRRVHFGLKTFLLV